MGVTGEGAGPKSLVAKTMIIHDLPTLSYAELIRAKLRAFNSRDASWDGEDILFLLTAAGGDVPKDQIPAEHAEYFIENFEWEGNESQKNMAVKSLLP
jgi:hypothetical protein